MSDAYPRPARAISPRHGLWLLGLLLAALVLVSLSGESGQAALRYQRDAVLHGEYWRLLTGHFVHGSATHLLLNGAGLALVAALFPRDYSLREWLVVLALSIVAIDIGFVWLEPQLQWYVGLSGVLHGALAAGAVAWWRHEPKALALALSAIFLGKLGWEHFQGPLPLSGDMPVVVNAHLYGAIGGGLAGAILWLGGRYRSSHWPSGS